MELLGARAVLGRARHAAHDDRDEFGERVGVGAFGELAVRDALPQALGDGRPRSGPDLAQLVLDLGGLGSVVDRAGDDEAAGRVAGIGVVDGDLVEHPLDRAARGGLLGERRSREGAVCGLVAVYGLAEEAALVAERGVEAGGADAHRVGERGDRGGLVPVLPEQGEGLLQRGVSVERPGSSSSHAPIV
jgi:hypothetical protein